jgi:hypothetical protein
MGSRDSSTRIVAEANRSLAGWENENTGEHKLRHITLAHKYRKLRLWAVLSPFVVAIIGATGWWLWGAAVEKVKAQLTADVVADVATVATDVGALKTDNTVIKSQLSEHSHVLRRIEEKIDKW